MYEMRKGGFVIGSSAMKGNKGQSNTRGDICMESASGVDSCIIILPYRSPLQPPPHPPRLAPLPYVCPLSAHKQHGKRKREGGRGGGGEDTHGQASGDLPFTQPKELVVSSATDSTPMKL